MKLGSRLWMFRLMARWQEVGVGGGGPRGSVSRALAPLYPGVCGHESTRIPDPSVCLRIQVFVWACAAMHNPNPPVPGIGGTRNTGIWLLPSEHSVSRGEHGAEQPGYHRVFDFVIPRWNYASSRPQSLLYCYTDPGCPNPIVFSAEERGPRETLATRISLARYITTRYMDIPVLTTAAWFDNIISKVWQLLQVVEAHHLQSPVEVSEESVSTPARRRRMSERATLLRQKVSGAGRQVTFGPCLACMTTCKALATLWGAICV